jgi:hypothetical protein
VGKTIKYTDLSGESPGPRALVDNLPQEDIEFSGELPLVGGKMTMKATLTPGSPLARLVATLTLTTCGCACVVTLYLIGLPRWAAASSLVLPIVIYLGFSSRQRGK